MHFSHAHTRVAGRVVGACVALIASLLSMGLLSGQARATNTFCPDGSTTVWTGSGQWSDQGGWSNGLPTNSCDAVIQSGTVTLTTVSDHYGNEDTVGAKGLTIDPGATVVVQGESSDVIGDWYNATNLNVGVDGMTIDQGATLDIEASGATETPVQGGSTGGSANVTVDSFASSPANLTNNGTIVTSTSDAAWGESLNVGGTFDNAGTVTDQSGLLKLQGQQLPYVLDNSGSFTVDSGASATMVAGDGSRFTNTGSVANQGTFTLLQSMHWQQSGGTETGNPVEFTGGETLDDSAGAGNFEEITGCGTAATVTGTIPQGQTITVQPQTANCSGDNGQFAVLGLGTSNSDTVVNDGTLVLNASGSGTSSGGNAQIDGGTLDNHGTLDATVTDPSFANSILSPLINEPGANVNVTGGKLYQTAGTATVNSGNVNVGPGATWIVQGGSFTNKGTLTMPIAGATSYGNFTMTAGGMFNAGGTLAPTLDAYTPPAGQEFQLFNIGSFSGKFGAVGGGFRADYSKEQASPAFVGVIYGAAAGAGKSPTAAKPRGGAGKVTDKLSCSKGKACAKVTLVALHGKTTVAKASGTAKPGKSATLTARLNKAGLKLLRTHKRLKLKVELKLGGKTLRSATVTVSRAAKKKKKK